MKQIRKYRDHIGLKVLAVILAVTFSFSLVFAAVAAGMFYFNGAKYDTAESSPRYTQLIEEYSAMAVKLYLRENYPGSIDDEISESEEQVEWLTDILTDSGFYYQLTEDSSGVIAASNLADGQSASEFDEFFSGQSMLSLYLAAYDFTRGIGWNTLDQTDDAGEDIVATMEIANPRCFYRLEEDGQLTALGLIDSTEIETALAENTLYVTEDIDGVLHRVLEYSAHDTDIVIYEDGEETIYPTIYCKVDIDDLIQPNTSYSRMVTAAFNCTLYIWTGDGMTDFTGDEDELDTLASNDINFYVLSNTENTFVEQITLADSIMVTYDEDSGSWSYGAVYQIYSDMESSEYVAATDTADAVSADNGTYTLSYKIEEVDGVATEFDAAASLWQQYNQQFSNMILLAALSAAVIVLSTVWLCFAAGHSRKEPDDSVICQNPIDRIWLEIICLFWIIAMLILVILASNTADYYAWNVFGLYTTESTIFGSDLITFCALIGGIAVLGTAVSLILLLTAVRRGKAGTLLQSMLIYRLWIGLCALCRLIRRNTPLAVKAAAAYVLYTTIISWLLWFVWARYIEILFPVVLLIHIAVLALLLYWILCLQEIKRAASDMRTGRPDINIGTKRMPPDLKELSEDLNHLSEGMQSALEKQFRSERFKTELITNVSHDLKTPLTSIINYVDLLKGTEISDPHAQEYLEILDRKSQSLKKLTDDLFEASKASSGALPVTSEEIDLCQLLNQALGEYDEKLNRAGLQAVLKLPDQPAIILADGQHLWRVLDNLLSNCVKYAMTGTRIYIDLGTNTESAVLEIKNISAEPLNLTEEELVTRFVRGERSRSTEGSGLGLSIAQSLTELMGGTFRLSVDGDLFKVTITMPLMQQK